MRIRVAVLADYANIADQGKLNVMGIFSLIFAQDVPTVHPQMQLVSQFEFDPSESGIKDIKFVLQDEDGPELFQASGKIDVKRDPRGLPTIANQILVINGARFPHFGSYEFKILINERVEATIPLEVAKPPAVPAKTSAE